MGYYTDINRVFTFIGEPTLKDIFSDIGNIITAVAVTPQAELDSRLKHPLFQAALPFDDKDTLGDILRGAIDFAHEYDRPCGNTLPVSFIDLIDTWEISRPTTAYSSWITSPTTEGHNPKPITHVYCRSSLKDYGENIRGMLRNLMYLAPFSRYIVDILNTRDGDASENPASYLDQVRVDYLLGRWEGLDIGEDIEDINPGIMSEYGALDILKTVFGKQILLKLFREDVNYIEAVLHAIDAETQGLLYPVIEPGLHVSTAAHVLSREEDEKSIKILDEIVSQLPFTEDKNIHNESFCDLDTDHRGSNSHMILHGKPRILDILAPGVQATLTVSGMCSEGLPDKYRATITIKSGSRDYQKREVPYSVRNVMTLVNMSKNPTAGLVGDLWLATLGL